MGMVETARDWTVERWRELPADGNRYELVDGELLVTPSPALPHQLASFELARLIADYVERFRVGLTVIAPADVHYDDRTVVEPDIFVAPPLEGRRPRSYADLDGLLLAVEVISPSSARADRITKRRLYQRQRVPEYWIVDLDARLVERWRPDDDRPELLSERLDWQPAPQHPPLSVSLSAYFRKVLQD
jgi:Uma2 family endonuclease